MQSNIAAVCICITQTLVPLNRPDQSELLKAYRGPLVKIHYLSPKALSLAAHIAHATISKSLILLNCGSYPKWDRHCEFQVEDVFLNIGEMSKVRNVEILDVLTSIFTAPTATYCTDFANVLFKSKLSKFLNDEFKLSISAKFSVKIPRLWSEG